MTNGWLSLEAVVRTNDANVALGGEVSTNLAAGSWTNLAVTSTVSSNQTGVLPGCQRRVYWVPADGSKKFLRLRAQ